MISTHSRVILTCTIEDAVASFFTPLSRKEPEKTSWRIVNNSLLIGRYRTGDNNCDGPPSKRRRIAGFDFVTTTYSRSVTKTVQRVGPDEVRFSYRILHSYNLRLGINLEKTGQIGSGGTQVCLES